MATEHHATRRPGFDKSPNDSACMREPPAAISEATVVRTPPGPLASNQLASEAQALADILRLSRDHENLNQYERGLIAALTLAIPILVWAFKRWRQRRKHAQVRVSAETNNLTDGYALADAGKAALDQAGISSGRWSYKLAKLFVWAALLMAVPALAFSRAAPLVFLVFMCCLCWVIIVAINAPK